jgi:hypothetical protein
MRNDFEFIKLICTHGFYAGEKLWKPLTDTGDVSVFEFGRWALSPGGVKLDARSYRIGSCVLGKILPDRYRS